MRAPCEHCGHKRLFTHHGRPLADQRCEDCPYCAEIARSRDDLETCAGDPAHLHHSHDEDPEVAPGPR